MTTLIIIVLVLLKETNLGVIISSFSHSICFLLKRFLLSVSPASFLLQHINSGSLYLHINNTQNLNTFLISSNVLLVQSYNIVENKLRSGVMFLVIFTLGLQCFFSGCSHLFYICVYYA